MTESRFGICLTIVIVQYNELFVFKYEISLKCFDSFYLERNINIKIPIKVTVALIPAAKML